MAALPTIECPQCGVSVPDASFCGACGAHLIREGPRAAQRLHSYAAFPDEPVLHLSLVSSLFPHLSHRAKAPFRAALGLIFVLLLVFVAAGTSAPLTAVCALGTPLLFVLYLREVDPYEDSYLVPSGICILLGAGLGAGWALIAGPYVDRALQPSTLSSLTSGPSTIAAVVVPAVAEILMCLPAFVIWLMQRKRMESLDGFAAGATGALGFTLASTITLLAPWLTSGPLLHQSATISLAQAVSRGLSWPLTSALVTGLVGAAWSVTLGQPTSSARGRWLTSPALALAFALVIQIGLGFSALAALPTLVLTAVNVLSIFAVIVVTRILIHHLLLHEAEDVVIGPPQVCPHCTHVVPIMAFCPNCGVAERAGAQSHHRSERSPLPDEIGWPTASAGATASVATFPRVRWAESRRRSAIHRTMVVRLGAGLTILALILILATYLSTPAAPPRCQPLKCQGPPIGNPFDAAVGAAVTSGTLYSNKQGFTVRYYPLPGAPSVPQVTEGTGGLQLTYPFKSTDGGTGQLTVIGSSAAGTSAQTVLTNIVNEIAPGAQSVYSIPGALVGYQPGIGEAYNVQPVSSAGSAQTDRLIVLVAIKNGFWIAVVAEGQLLRNVGPGSDFWDGHPSPADVNVAFVGDPTVNSITFPSS
jgi:hypothetical protein